ncbi:MAG: YdeI/OmpD-associated family protein [Methanosarcinales archaeon]|jgi:uncharacterized protein YdeI (YjbR/CyaY-like superfamily)|nr:YdeI/OmpD-associated family protein [Methanosarcinales archaeon]
MALKRDIHPIPDYVLSALESEDLVERYRSRPPYQQNDYIGWITRAKRQETIDKRLNQMLTELRNGDKYMGMDYRSK